MSQLPEWASDENFPAGSKPWNGQPTRVEPSATIKARGFLPGTVPPAGWFNYLLGILIDESNDQDLRLAAAEALTLQGAFDNSVTAGNDPTIALKASGAGQTFTLYDSTGRAVLSAQGESATALSLTPPASGSALNLRGRGYVSWSSEDNSKAVSLRAPSGLSETYSQEFPTAKPAAASVMRRAAGSSPASDWVAMDWGDTDGGGSGWTATVGSTDNPVDNVAVDHGTWSRVGNTYTFAISGTFDLFDESGEGGFTILSPTGGAISKLTQQASAAQGLKFTPISNVEGYPGTIGLNLSIAAEDAAAASDVRWSISGQFSV